jgi:Xaa-Pro dipeptidase
MRWQPGSSAWKNIGTSASFAQASTRWVSQGTRIWPRNPKRMRGPDTLGREKHWILEIHLVDPERRFEGFYKRLI